MTESRHHFKPTILGQFSGADQSRDSEAVSRADRKTSSGHGAGAAAQTSWRSVGVVVVLAGWLQGQVAVDILHTLAVTLNRQRIVNVASRPDVAKKGYFQNIWIVNICSCKAEEEKQQERSSFSLLIYQLSPEGRNDKQWLKSAIVEK